MDKPTVTISCLAYRSLKTTPAAIASAWNLDYAGPIEILIREQGSDHEELKALQQIAEELGQTPTRSITVIQSENLGFAGGHNAVFRRAKGEFILALNADAVLQPDFLTNALAAFTDPRIGAVQGKLLRWNLEQQDTPVLRDGTPVIDTTGLLPLLNRRIVNRGMGETDSGQFDEPGEVWGADGAVPVYRKAALDDVAFPRATSDKAQATSTTPEYYDEDFFAYKEDVDLAWRLQWRGWKTAYVPTAVAWHGRGAGENAATDYRAIIAERRKISPLLKYYSFSNQRLLLFKNERWSTYLRDLPKWFVKETGAWGYALLFEARTLPAIWRTLKLLPTMRKKRAYTMSRRAPDANPYRFFV
jgi:GT2 family glycosyltransferase